MLQREIEFLCRNEHGVAEGWEEVVFTRGTSEVVNNGFFLFVPLSSFFSSSLPLLSLSRSFTLFFPCLARTTSLKIVFHCARMDC